MQNTVEMQSEMQTKNTIKVYLWILSFFYNKRSYFFFYIMSFVLITLVELCIPKFIGYFIDTIVPRRDLELLYRNVTMVLIAVVILILLYISRNYLELFLSEHASIKIQNTLLSHLYNLGFPYIETKSSGELLALFNSEVTSVQNIYKQYFRDTFRYLLLSIFSISIMFWINYKLTLIIIPSFILYYIISPGLNKKTFELTNQVVKLNMGMNKKIYDTISSLLELKAFGATQWNHSEVLSEHRTFGNKHIKNTIFVHLRGSLRRFIVFIGGLSLFSYGIYLVKNNQLDLGEFVAFSFYYFLLIDGFTLVYFYINEQILVMSQANKLYHLSQTNPLIREMDEPIVPSQFQGDIQFKDVSFAYSNNKVLFENVSFQASPGQKIAIVGSSGNGKSTLLKLIGRFYDPSIGEIFIDGIPLKSLSLSHYRERIGYIFQDTYLFADTIMENIRFGKPEASDEEVMEAALHAFAHDFINGMPDGYQTFVGERGVKLSGGQKQRIAIARLFLKQPVIAILDEATSALDQLSEQEVLKAFDGALKHSTVITVAHRLSTIKHYDKILYLEDGNIAEEGTYEELMKLKKGFYLLSEGQSAMEKGRL